MQKKFRPAGLNDPPTLLQLLCQKVEEEIQIPMITNSRSNAATATTIPRQIQ